jgi:hypothetical protein
MHSGSVGLQERPWYVVVSPNILLIWDKLKNGMVHTSYALGIGLLRRDAANQAVINILKKQEVCMCDKRVVTQT